MNQPLFSNPPSSPVSVPGFFGGHTSRAEDMGMFYGLDLPMGINFFGPESVKNDLVSDADFGSGLYKFINSQKKLGLKGWIGLPDLHVSKDAFTGSVSVYDGRIIPKLLGPDIHCGVQLVKTGISSGDFPWKTIIDDYKRSNTSLSVSNPLNLFSSGVESSLRQNSGIADAKVYSAHFNGSRHFIDAKDLLQRYTDERQASKMISDSIGTIGGGNHFIELAVAQDDFDFSGLKKNEVVVLIHTGSRKFGGLLQRELSRVSPAEGILPGTDLYDDVPRLFQLAGMFAYINRTALAEKVAQAVFLSQGLMPSFKAIADIPHDTFELRDGLSIHRKGAARIPSVDAPHVIPAHSADGSALMLTHGDHLSATFQSLCHGTGRALSRSDAKELIDTKDEMKRLSDVILSYELSSKSSETPTSYRDLMPALNFIAEQGWIEKPIWLKPRASIKD